MKRDTRMLRALALAAGAGLALAGAWTAATLAMLRSTLKPAEQAAAAALLEPRWPLLVLMAVALAAVAALLAQWVYERWIAPPARLLEQARVLVDGGLAHALQPPEGASAEGRGLVETVNALVAQREQLRGEIEQRAAEASRSVELERSRLAALMAELLLSVVVCNLDGRVLLYNQRARLQFKAVSSAPQLAEGAELLGLGRSIYTVFDRALVAHALERIQHRMARGAAAPAAQFVTVTARGQLLCAQMAPVRDSAAADAPLAGFVLLLDNITRD